MIARLTDELPQAQVAALNDQVKVPLVYGTVLLNNWRAWKRAGITSIGTPGGFWQDVALDFPVHMGELRCPASPDEPILLHLGKVVVPGTAAIRARSRPPGVACSALFTTSTLDAVAMREIDTKSRTGSNGRFFFRLGRMA